MAASALVALGIPLDGFRREVEKTAGPSDKDSTGSPPFTPRAKRVLELSLREALQLGHNHIGTEHLLLGLIRKGEGVAYRVLPVSPADQFETFEAVDVLFVYCLHCGVMLAHTSAKEIGLASGAGSQVVAFEHVSWTAASHRPERVIAEGVTADAVRWTLSAGGDDESYGTMLRTEDAAGVIDSGGMGGPKLWGAELLNVYSGGNPERGRRGIVVRCDPSIDQLSVVYEDGNKTEMVTCGPVDGLRLAVLLVRRRLAFGKWSGLAGTEKLSHVSICEAELGR